MKKDQIKFSTYVLFLIASFCFLALPKTIHAQTGEIEIEKIGSNGNTTTGPGGNTMVYDWNTTQYWNNWETNYDQWTNITPGDALDINIDLSQMINNGSGMQFVEPQVGECTYTIGDSTGCTPDYSVLQCTISDQYWMGGYGCEVDLTNYPTVVPVAGKVLRIVFNFSTNSNIFGEGDLQTEVVGYDGSTSTAPTYNSDTELMYAGAYLNDQPNTNYWPNIYTNQQIGDEVETGIQNYIPQVAECTYNVGDYGTSRECMPNFNDSSEILQCFSGYGLPNNGDCYVGSYQILSPPAGKVLKIVFKYPRITGNVQVQRVGLDGTTNTVPTSTYTNINASSSSGTQDNPITYTNQTDGTSYVTNIPSYSVLVATCTGSSCTVANSDYVPAQCTSFECSENYTVQEGQTTNVFFKYAPPLSSEAEIVAVGANGASGSAPAGLSAFFSNTTPKPIPAFFTAVPLTSTDLQDASFENPNEGGRYDYRVTSTPWSFKDNSGIQSNGSAWGAAPAPDGTQTAFIQSTGSDSSFISQVIDLTSGNYVLSYYESYRAGYGTEPITISLDGTQIDSFTPNSTNFSERTANFNVPSSGMHILKFLGSEPSGDGTDRGTFIDNIQISHQDPSLDTVSVSATNISADAVRAGSCVYPIGGTECSVNSYSLVPTCSGSYCSIATSTYPYDVTKVVFKYSSPPPSDLVVGGVGSNGTSLQQNFAAKTTGYTASTSNPAFFSFLDDSETSGSGSGVTDVTNGLVGWWKLDEGSGSQTIDSTGNHGEATFVGSPEWSSGVSGNALTFNGSNYVQTTAVMPNANSFSYSFWAKSSAGTDGAVDNRPFGAADGINGLRGTSILWDAQSNALHLVSRDGVNDWLDDVAATETNMATGWHLVTAVFSPTSGESLYWDGQLVGSNPVIAGIASGDLQLRIGGEANTTAFNFNGSIDDVRIYNRPLTSDEVQSIYQAVPGANNGPVGWWKFDAGSATFTADSSGNGNSVINTGGTQVSGVLNTAISLSATGANATVADDPSLENGNDLTVSLWVKNTNGSEAPDGIGQPDWWNAAPLIQKDKNHYFPNDWNIVERSGYVDFVTGNPANPTTGDGGSNYDQELLSTVKVDDGQWHLITLTRDQNTGTKSIYIDGVLNTSAGGCAQSLSNDQPIVMLGAGGALDDVRIYPRVLSTGEIQALYSALSGAGSQQVYGVNLPGYTITAGMTTYPIGSSGTVTSFPITTSNGLTCNTTADTDGYKWCSVSVSQTTGDVTKVAFQYSAIQPSEVEIKGVANGPGGLSTTAVPAGYQSKATGFSATNANPAFFSIAVSGGDTASGLIDKWSFNEGSGYSSTDPVGGDTASLDSGVTWVTGHSGSAVVTTNGVVTVGTNPLIYFSPNSTLDMWVKRSDATAGTIYSEDTYWGSENALSITADGEAQLSIKIPEWVTVSTPANSVPVGAWTEITSTLSKLNGTISIDLYVNGTLVGTLSQSGDFNGSNGSADGVHLGGQKSTYNGTSNLFNGAIDDVSIYNRTLSSLDVQSLNGGNGSIQSVIAYAKEFPDYTTTVGTTSYKVGFTETSVSNYYPIPSANCDTTWCSVSTPVSLGNVSKVVFLYTPTTPQTTVYCYANPSTQIVNQPVYWNAVVSPATPVSGSYSYSWTGDFTSSLIKPSSSSTSVGVKNETLTVTDGSISATAQCSVTVVNKPQFKEF